MFILIYIHTSNLIKARYDVLFIVLMSEPLTMFWCWGWTSACSKSALNPQKSNLALANSALFSIWFSPWKAIYPQIGLYYYGRFFFFYNTQKKHLQCYAVGLLCGTNAWRLPGEAWWSFPLFHAGGTHPVAEIASRKWRVGVNLTPQIIPPDSV